MSPITKANLRLALLAASALAAPPAMAQSSAPASPTATAASTQTLEQQFDNPPQSARPRVWWHWMNGNISRDGIARDLDWMHRMGIGGLQNFDANLSTPQIVDHRLVYMTPEWRDAFRFAAQEADRLGLELAIAASPGWSETGGPWVPPEDGLKKLVWSETEIAGGGRLTAPLAPPPTTTGPFQSAAKPRGIEEMMAGATATRPTPVHYQDVAVLAFPVAQSPVAAQPHYTALDGSAIAAASLTDGDLQSVVEMARTADVPLGILATYPAPTTVQTASIFLPGAAAMFLGASVRPTLEASDDGTTWRSIAAIPVTPVPTTISFAPVTARYFRVLLEPNNLSMSGMSAPAPGVDLSALGGMAAARNQPVRIGDLRLSAEPRIDRFEAKAGFELEPDYYSLSAGLAETTGVAPEAVVDLTSHMRPDGMLDWTPPAGSRWRILRMGWSLLGTTNHPAPAEATGLEVDKFDGPAVRRYLEHYLGMYREAAGNNLVGARGVQALLTDSIEVGAANWTPQMVAQFHRLRGYDPTPWLPTLTGTIIGSREASDRFLYDYRRTLADLMASEHYGTVAAVAHENGLRVYGEALENDRPSLGDDMAMRRYADIPMSALWTHGREEGPRYAHLADIRGAASVSHIYGQNLVAAESLTSAMAWWDHGPAYLKRIIDLAFVNGVNRPVIHTSVHQPDEAHQPGLSLFFFGQYFNRHEAWGELAKPWVDYMARNSLMLQQGCNVADVGYFYGEEAPLTALYTRGPAADAPRAYAYDFVNADALASALHNDGADIATPGCGRYKLLYLGGTSRRMTLASLRRVAALADAGATIVGTAPEGDPGLAEQPAEYAALLARLWPGAAMAHVGQGRVIASTDVEAALASIGTAPDFRFTGGSDGARIPFVHRRLSDGDSYFIVNQLDRSETVEAHFRVTGKAPELWHAETGTSEPVSYRIENGETIVPLTLRSDESVHVVFRRVATRMSLTVAAPHSRVIARLDGPWTVAFQPERRAPDSTIMPTLQPLDQNAEPGIRYFSGIATYRQDVTLRRRPRTGQPVWLDLGEAREVAEVRVNGELAGYAWHAPYRIDIGRFVRAGTNQVEVRVGNLWVNRLIGDAQPGADRVAWTAMPTYRADAPLRRSGLIGPVTISQDR